MTRDYKDFAEYILRHYRDTSIVEIGIGADFKVFKELKKHKADIRAVDINPSSDDVIKDDALNPNMDIYRGCGLIYSVRPPPELIPYIEKIAQKAGADLIVRPLSTDNVPTGLKLQNYGSSHFFKKLH
jgi:uncharacterized UPF0146 family protein